jgi:hypothetical protein
MRGKEGEGQPELQPPLALAGGAREGRGLLARPYTLRVVQAVTALCRPALRRGRGFAGGEIKRTRWPLGRGSGRGLDGECDGG